MPRATIAKAENGYVVYEAMPDDESKVYVFSTLKTAMSKVKAILEPVASAEPASVPPASE